jgi:hypothetical protein
MTMKQAPAKEILHFIMCRSRLTAFAICLRAGTNITSPDRRSKQFVYKTMLYVFNQLMPPCRKEWPKKRATSMRTTDPCKRLTREYGTDPFPENTKTAAPAHKTYFDCTD